MTRLAHMLVAAALALPGTAFAKPAPPAAITRIAATPPGLILTGVHVPAGAEMLYLSGQLADPVDPASKGKPGLTMADYGDTRTQTISLLTKVRAALAAQGFAMSDVIKLTVFVAGDPKLDGKMDFAGMNEGFKTFFGSADNPATVARSTVQVAALAAPMFLVEIEATAARMPAK